MKNLNRRFLIIDIIILALFIIMFCFQWLVLKHLSSKVVLCYLIILCVLGILFIIFGLMSCISYIITLKKELKNIQIEQIQDTQNKNFKEE